MAADQLPDDLDALLIGEKMGLLDPAERDRLWQAMSNRPSMQADLDRVGDALTPLDAWQSPEAPTDLAQSVMAHVEQAAQDEEPVETIRLDPNTSQPTRTPDSSLFPSLMSIRETLAIAASILIIVGVFVPSYYGVRRRSQDAMNARNMSVMERAVSPYAIDPKAPTIYRPRIPRPSYLPPLDEDLLRPIHHQSLDGLGVIQDANLHRQRSARRVLRFRFHIETAIPEDQKARIRAGLIRLLTSPTVNIAEDGDGDQDPVFSHDAPLGPQVIPAFDADSHDRLQPLP